MNPRIPPPDVAGLRRRAEEAYAAKLARVAVAVAAGWEWDPTEGKWGEWRRFDPTLEPARPGDEPGGWVLWGGGRG